MEQADYLLDTLKVGKTESEIYTILSDCGKSVLQALAERTGLENSRQKSEEFLKNYITKQVLKNNSNQIVSMM